MQSMENLECCLMDVGKMDGEDFRVEILTSKAAALCYPYLFLNKI